MDRNFRSLYERLKIKPEIYECNKCHGLGRIYIPEEHKCDKCLHTGIVIEFDSEEERRFFYTLLHMIAKEESPLIGVRANIKILEYNPQIEFIDNDEIDHIVIVVKEHGIVINEEEIITIW